MGAAFTGSILKAKLQSFQTWHLQTQTPVQLGAWIREASTGEIQPGVSLLGCGWAHHQLAWYPVELAPASREPLKKVCFLNIIEVQNKSHPSSASGRPGFPSPIQCLSPCPTYGQRGEARAPANIDFETSYKSVQTSASYKAPQLSQDLSKTTAVYTAFSLSHRPTHLGFSTRNLLDTWYLLKPTVHRLLETKEQV